MEEKDHISGVGNIVLNLQALESLLRGFLVEKYGQCSGFPKMGDKVACRNYLTNFVSLGDLIKDYHWCLEDHEKHHRIDESVVLSETLWRRGGSSYAEANPKPPFELWKFGGPTARERCPSSSPKR